MSSLIIFNPYSTSNLNLSSEDPVCAICLKTAKELKQENTALVAHETAARVAHIYCKKCKEAWDDQRLNLGERTLCDLCQSPSQPLITPESIIDRKIRNLSIESFACGLLFALVFSYPIGAGHFTIQDLIIDPNAATAIDAGLTVALSNAFFHFVQHGFPGANLRGNVPRALVGCTLIMITAANLLTHLMSEGFFAMTNFDPTIPQGFLAEFSRVSLWYCVNRLALSHFFNVG